MVRRAILGPAAGAALSALLYLHPALYPYGPIVSGLFVGAVFAEGLREGAKLGGSMGLILGPLALVMTIALGTTGLSAVMTGITVLFESMRGMGSEGILFYVVVAYFLTIYTILMGVLTGGVGGALTRIHQGVISG